MEFTWSCLTSIKVIIFYFQLDYLNNRITDQLMMSITFVTIMIVGHMV